MTDREALDKIYKLVWGPSVWMYGSATEVAILRILADVGIDEEEEYYEGKKY